MPAAIAAPLRQRLLALLEQGCPISQAAPTLGIAPRSARRLRARARLRAADADPLATDFQHCGRRRSPRFEQLRQAAAQVRRQHPTWGAGRLRCHLQEQFGRHDLPAQRTLQRWLQQLGLAFPPGDAGRTASA
jgi:hypothetical protein